MGKFDGYLICSDVDGTFHMGDTIAVNSEAVKYFTDLGGRFTFATGRTVDYLLRPDLNVVINAPACLFNGSVVYDYQAKRLLLKKRVDFTLEAFLQSVAPMADSIGHLYLYDNHTGDGLIFDDLTKIPADCAQLKSLKVICTFRSPAEADRFQAFARQLPLAKSSYISKSWGVGVEFNAMDSTKGHALDFIKAHLGNIHTAIGIGDYENDIPLLTHADMGVAVDNALPAVKQVADRIVCSGDKYALQDLIRQLDREIP